MVAAENCAHQLHTSFQGPSSKVLEAGVGVLVMEVAICLFGFDVGVGFGKRAEVETCAQRLRSASSPLIDIPSKLLCFDDLHCACSPAAQLASQATVGEQTHRKHQTNW